eukprot:Pgem_evm1s1984
MTEYRKASAVKNAKSKHGEILKRGKGALDEIYEHLPWWCQYVQVFKTRAVTLSTSKKMSTNRKKMRDILANNNSPVNQLNFDRDGDNDNGDNDNDVVERTSSHSRVNSLASAIHELSDSIEVSAQHLTFGMLLSASIAKEGPQVDFESILHRYNEASS